MGENIKEKKNINKKSLLITIGVLLIIVAGIVIANIILKGNGSGLFNASVVKCYIPNCQLCQPNNPEKCSKCKSGYTLNGGKCIKNVTCNVSNCAKCSSNNYCSKCNSGYTLKNGRCEITCNVLNCTNCSKPNYCSKCNEGYYAKNGKCTLPIQSISFANSSYTIKPTGSIKVNVNPTNYFDYVGDGWMTCSISDPSAATVSVDGDLCIFYDIVKETTVTLTAKIGNKTATTKVKLVK